MKKLKDNILKNLLNFFPIVYYFYTKTLRIKIFGNKTYLPSRIKKGKNNCIFCFWHSQIFPLIYSHRNKRIAVLVSRHRDGELIAKVLKNFKFNLARGSFKRKGEIGFLSLRKFLKKGFCVAITPDGPRGPRWVFKEGAIALSRETKKPLILVGTGYSKFIEFKSWDRFKLPLPFSKVAIYISEPFYPREENFKKFISEKLSYYTSFAFELSKSPKIKIKG